MQVELISKRFQGSQYYKTGKGKPILLLHGFAEDSHIWEQQILSLEKEYCVIAPDLPGSGSSPMPQEEITMELLSDFVSEILIQEQIDQFILMGHSMGGYIALAFAEQHEDQLLAFSLVHSSAYEDNEEKKENRRKSIKLIANDGKEVFLSAMIPNLYSETSKNRLKNEMANHLTMAMGISSNALQAYYNAMILRPSRIHVLRNTKLPVQFVIGKEDKAIPFDQSLKQCYIPQISKVDILDEIGHSSMVESPDKLSSILNSFCKYVLNYKMP